MKIEMFQMKSREDWLEARADKIGGSDAAAIVGLHPYKSNVELWEEKMGVRPAADVSDSAAVQYGSAAEAPIRELFALDFPQFKVDYVENNMWVNDLYPWAHASLDGWLTDQEGRKGILEIKTATIHGRAQAVKWEDRVPDNYYCQLLHYFAVTDFEFAILKARLRQELGDGRMVIKETVYHFDRETNEQDIVWLMQKEYLFYSSLLHGVKPPRILPEL